MNKSILPKHNDMITDSILLEESYAMVGTKCTVVLARRESKEVGYAQDIIFDEDNKIETNILIHDHPQPKLLKQLGWDFESDDDYTKPMLVSIPRYLSTKSEDGLKQSDYFELCIEKYAKVIIDWDYERPVRVFQVSEVSSNMFNAIFYFMKLVPYRERQEPDPGPLNDPNLKFTDKDDQFKHINFGGDPRSEEIQVKY